MIFFQRNFAFGEKIKKYVFSIHPILTNFFRVLSYNQLIIRMLPREDVTHGPD
ncbi:unknown [Bacteroides sp. CAG:927]|nr:unknown [Bacteroides sp. CAG:927]